MSLADPSSLDARIADLKWLAAKSDDPLERVTALAHICALRREQYAQMHSSSERIGHGSHGNRSAIAGLWSSIWMRRDMAGG